MSRRAKQDIDILHLLSSVDKKPEPINTYALSSSEARQSKTIKIYTNDSPEHLIGYYDYTINAFVAYKPSEVDRATKTKVKDTDIKGWMYL